MNDQEWMALALDEARAAMEFAEIPVASILVGDNKEIIRGQTQVRRRGSIAAHGELYAILDAKAEVYKYESLTIYTTLEPCLMCVGAGMQAGVKRYVFGMKAAPDGAANMTGSLAKSGFEVPDIVGGVLEMEEVALMREFASQFPDSPALPYVDAMLAIYS
jgi:tRNA(adenine34) deaminase